MENLDRFRLQLEQLGYMALGEFGIPGRRFYVKVADDQTHHIHAFEVGLPEIDRHLGFRGFLRESRVDAKADAALKRKLAKIDRDDPDGYSEAKSEFMRRINAKAQKRYLQSQG